MTQDRGDALVAYLTRSGNTRTIAEGLSRMTGAEIVEVRPVAPYPADYQAHVDQAQHERDEGILPKVEPPAVDLASFRTL